MSSKKERSEWLCPQCSSVVHNGDKFCRDCGVQLNWSLSSKPVQNFATEVENPRTQRSDSSHANEVPESASNKASEGSSVAVIVTFVVIALTAFLFLASGQSDDESDLASKVSNSQQGSGEPDYYKERIAPHIVSGYAWNNFKIESGISGNGSISEFSSQLFDYLDGISPVTRSGLEASMDPGNGLSNLLYAIIDDEGTVDLIYTWLRGHASA